MFSYSSLGRIRRLERFLKDSPEHAELSQECADQTIWYSYSIDPITHELIYSINR
jgi:hypothetical protein